MAVGIFCWDGSLAVLILPHRRPISRFATGWVDGAPAGVGTLSLFR